MSYILDALRKSDQQRQRGTAPTLQSAQAPMHIVKKPLFLVYGVLGTILLGAGMTIGWLRPWQPEHPVPLTGPVAVKPPAADSGRAATPAPLPTSSVLTEELPPTVRADARQPRSSHKTKSSAPKVPPLPTSGKSVAPASRSGTTQERRVLTLSELPPAIQQEIPPMSISVHAYSPRPANRLVGINDRMLREGGTLPPGLTLEQITPEGMVFSYKGYRFRRGLGAAESR